jgi:hypothetical protein
VRAALMQGFLADMIESSWGQRLFSVCTGSRETSFDEGVYVLDRGAFDDLIQ